MSKPLVIKDICLRNEKILTCTVDNNNKLLKEQNWWQILFNTDLPITFDASVSSTNPTSGKQTWMAQTQKKARELHIGDQLAHELLTAPPLDMVTAYVNESKGNFV